MYNNIFHRYSGICSRNNIITLYIKKTREHNIRLNEYVAYNVHVVLFSYVFEYI